MNDVIVAIDPGSSTGAIAVTKDGGKTVNTFNMPDSPERLYDWMFDFTLCHGIRAFVIEDVGHAQPGNAARSAYTFAKHRGHLEMACIAVGVTPVWVLPRKWMHALFPAGYPVGMENKKERKEFIYKAMLERWAGIQLNKRHADAAGILAWYVQQQEEIQ